LHSRSYGKTKIQKGKEANLSAFKILKKISVFAGEISEPLQYIY